MAIDAPHDWWHRLSDYVAEMNAASAMVIWTEQALNIARTVVLGLVAWGAVALVDARSEIAVFRQRVAEIERRLNENDARIAVGTDDRWRRRDHDGYAAQVESRLKLIEERQDAQGRNLNILLQHSVNQK